VEGSSTSVYGCDAGVQSIVYVVVALDRILSISLTSDIIPLKTLMNVNVLRHVIL
jgi:hypothetical protein